MLIDLRSPACASLFVFSNSHRYSLVSHPTRQHRPQAHFRLLIMPPRRVTRAAAAKPVKSPAKVRTRASSLNLALHSALLMPSSLLSQTAMKKVAKKKKVAKPAVFGDLPKELLNRIVAEAWEQDVAYGERKEEDDGNWVKPTHKMTLKGAAWIGKSVQALSLVSKQLRKIAAVHLFTVRPQFINKVINMALTLSLLYRLFDSRTRSKMLMHGLESSEEPSQPTSKRSSSTRSTSTTMVQDIKVTTMDQMTKVTRTTPSHNSFKVFPLSQTQRDLHFRQFRNRIE